MRSKEKRLSGCSVQITVHQSHVWAELWGDRYYYSAEGQRMRLMAYLKGGEWPPALQQPQSLMDFWISCSWSFAITLHLSSPTLPHTYLFFLIQITQVKLCSWQPKRTNQNNFECRILFREANQQTQTKCLLLRPLPPDY